jgi:hypothetical protein
MPSKTEIKLSLVRVNSFLATPIDNVSEFRQALSELKLEAPDINNAQAVAESIEKQRASLTSIQLHIQTLSQFSASKAASQMGKVLGEYQALFGVCLTEQLKTDISWLLDPAHKEQLKDILFTCRRLLLEAKNNRQGETQWLNYIRTKQQKGIYLIPTQPLQIKL